MSLHVREWLPAGALDGAASRRLADQAVSDWAANWFVRARIRASDFAACGGAAPSRPGGWRAGGAVAVAQSAAGTLRLAGLALAAETERLALTEADRDVIDRFAAASAADLAARLERAVGSAPAEALVPTEEPFAGAGGLTFSVLDSGGNLLLAVAIAAAALVPLRKAACPPPRRSGAPLAPLAGAVEAGTVRVCARLGSATLPLGELAALAAGDVLVLDRAVEDGAELVFGSACRPFARAAMVPGKAAISLLLAPQRD